MSLSSRTVLAVIPARCGSKGIPQKNIAPLAGKPLINWTIEAALGAECVSRTIVSTDCLEVADVARAGGAEVPFIRPSHLATDTATTASVIRHAQEECPGFDVLLVLQPTSPLRTSADIDAAFSQMESLDSESCASVCEVDTPPWLMYTQQENGQLESVLPPWPGGMRRQDFPPVYTLNGAIYFVSSGAFQRTDKLVSANTIGYVMPASRSVDIDTPQDFDRAETLISGVKDPFSL